MFEYQISPNAVPRTANPAEPSIVTLMITVTNKTGYDVEVRRLAFVITAGDAPVDLVSKADLSKIRPQTGAGTKWDFNTSGDGRFLAYPDYPVTGLLAGESVAFILSNVIVNSAIGHAKITVTETTNVPAETGIEVAKGDPGLAITEFLASPIQILPDGDSVLTWKTTGASRCTLTSQHGGTIEVDRNGSQPERPVETTQYTLSAEGGGRTIQQSITVTVATVRIGHFEVIPTQVVKGDQATFHWLVTGVESATLDPGGIALDPPWRGSLALPVEVSSPYTLTAKGYGRTDTRPGQVTVMPAAIGSLTAEPRIVQPGAQVKLGWTAQWASGFRVDPPGQVLERTVSELAVVPGQSTSYRLTALGLGEPARMVTVAVGPTIAAFGLTAHAGRPNEMVLAWQVECGAAELEVWTGGGPPPGKPTPVPSSADKIIPLARGQFTSVRLAATGGAGPAVATLTVAGTLAVGGTVLESLGMASPSGISTARSDVIVAWRTTQGVLAGSIRDSHSSKDLRGASGQVDLSLGSRAGLSPLWTGDVYLAPVSAAASGSVDDGGPADDIGLHWELS